MTGKIIVKFKLVNYKKIKKSLDWLIRDEVSMCSARIEDFPNIFDDTENMMSFENTEIIYFSDMYAFKIFAAPKDKQVTRGYQVGERYTIEINFSAETIISINNIKLKKMIAQLRD
ncbi:MAG: hypothetical protein WC823_03115 [Parcubacteria group bacterium]|jgi:hypothetical protein